MIKLEKLEADLKAACTALENAYRAYQAGLKKQRGGKETK